MSEDFDRRFKVDKRTFRGFDSDQQVAFARRILATNKKSCKCQRGLQCLLINPTSMDGLTDHCFASKLYKLATGFENMPLDELVQLSRKHFLQKCAVEST